MASSPREISLKHRIQATSPGNENRSREDPEGGVGAVDHGRIMVRLLDL